MARYKAIWIYGPQCTRAGQEKARREARTLPEFAQKLCQVYGNFLGDGFSCYEFKNEDAVFNCFGSDDLPDWFAAVTGYPVYVFSSCFGREILCNPTATAIINQIRGESYGDYDLTIMGV